MIRSLTWNPCPRGMVVPVVQEAPQSPHKVYRGRSYVPMFLNYTAGHEVLFRLKAAD